MNQLKYALLAFAILNLCVISSCKDDDTPENLIQINAGDTASDDAVAAFINVEDGWTIEFGEGTFNIGQALIMSDKNNIVIKGQGRDRTILDFSEQDSGGESIKISDGTGITLCNLTVQNGVSDAIKTQNIDGIRFSNIATNWVGDILTNNGNYGIYPVLCNNVEIDGCYTRGAADAGVYVGQSTNIVVSNNTIEENVAGIEIENCTGADVHSNTVQNNSAGILVYDLGNITSIPNGSGCRVYDNTIHNNNHQNFAPSATSLIGRLPVGSGVILLATDQVEVFNNTITSNNLAAISMASYEYTGESYDPSSGYDPRLRDVNIHDNTISRDAEFPAIPNEASQQIQQLLMLVTSLTGITPEIIYDGIPGLGTTADQNFRIVDNGAVNMLNFNMQADPTFSSATLMDLGDFAGDASFSLDAISVEGLVDCN